MVTGSGATASVSQPSEAKSPRGKRNLELIRHLRLIARQHKVCYEVWPASSISEEVQAEIGFELLLCGVNGHSRRERGALHPVASCRHCSRSYTELREVAEWIVPLRKPPLSYNIYAFDRALHLAPANRQHRSEIIITTAIFDRACDNRRDYCDSACLEETRERLYNLGIREDVWCAAASGRSHF